MAPLTFLFSLLTFLFFFLFLLLLPLFSSSHPKTNGTTVKELGDHTGYYRLPHSHDARMFYWFFESRTNQNDPVVMWLHGGPGCSSEVAVFYENGPFQIADNLSLTWNDYGWDKVSNLVYVDQPIGTGFTYSSDSRDFRHDEEGVSKDLYEFLQVLIGIFFCTEPFWAFSLDIAQNDFYITGESYAGHYIPAFASRVHRGNKNKEGVHINLKGFAIGNGLTNSAFQYRAYPDYALQMGMIEKPDYDKIIQWIPDCEDAIKDCGPTGGKTCLDAYYICNVIFLKIMEISVDTNYLDIRKQRLGEQCCDFSNMMKFLNKKQVKDALGVGMGFIPCNSTVYSGMLTDYMKNLEVGIPALLEDGIQVLVYAGEYDFFCNWLGNSYWVHAMEWSGQKAFRESSFAPFKVGGSEAGLLKIHGPLAFLKVHNAGHMVPMDQPKAALQMLTDWMEGKLGRDG